MKIRLRAPVIAADDSQVGRVERLLIDFPSLRVRRLVIGKRRSAASGWMVPFSQIAASATHDEGIHLTIPESAVQELPEHVDVDALRSASASSGDLPRMTSFGDLTTPQVGGIERHETAGSATTGERGDLVALSAATDIVSHDGRNLGRLTEIECDPDGRLVALVGRGRIFHHGEVRVDADAIISYSSRQVGVAITADEARAASGSQAQTSESAQEAEAGECEIVEGMRVEGEDGRRIGAIDQVIKDEGDVSALIIRHGLFGRRRTLLGAELVAGVSTDIVTLALNRREFKVLPDLET